MDIHGDFASERDSGGEVGRSVLASDVGVADIFDAARGHRVDCIKKFVAAGVDVNATNEFGNTPLHYAAAQNQVDMAAVLIEAGANPNVSNNNGQTPLSIARRKGSERLIALFAPAENAAHPR